MPFPPSLGAVAQDGADYEVDAGFTQMPVKLVQDPLRDAAGRQDDCLVGADVARANAADGVLFPAGEDDADAAAPN